jgi:hypothetical protein
MTSKRVLGVVAVIALVALSATGAQAGAGGTPSPLTSFFLCKGISGEDAGQRFDVDSIEPGAGWGVSVKNVRIGVATLACAFARLFPANSTFHLSCTAPNIPEGCNEISPNPSILGLNGLDLKCYAVSAARGQTGSSSPPPSYTVTDGLVGTDPNVTGSSIQYVCAPAQFLPH